MEETNDSSSAEFHETAATIAGTAVCSEELRKVYIAKRLQWQ